MLLSAQPQITIISYRRPSLAFSSHRWPREPHFELGGGFDCLLMLIPRKAPPINLLQL